MKTIDFHINFKNRGLAQKQVLYLLEALINMNRSYLRENPNAPNLYDAGVKYVHQQGKEDWFDIGTALSNGGGDCKILATWRIAELRERQGLGWKSVRPFLKWKRKSDGSFYLYHVLVLHAAPGKIFKLEDPSRLLGMDDVIRNLPSSD